MSDKPIVVDSVDEEEVYVASIELRSMGTGKNIYPQLKWSHIFKEEPEIVPYAYQAAIAIAERIGALVEETNLEEDFPEDLEDTNDVVRALENIMQAARDEGDDTIH